MLMSTRKIGRLTYEKCLKILNGKLVKQISYKTHLDNRGDLGYIGVWHHETEIIQFHPDGAIILNAGGYRSSTTKQRLNNFASAHIFQRNGKWFMGKGQKPYQDGVNIGVPRSEWEAMIQGYYDGDELSERAMHDYFEEHRDEILQQ